MNKTGVRLFIKDETPTIPLERIYEEYFGDAKVTAKLRAKVDVLTIQAFCLGTSKKLPWMVDISGFAAFIDASYEKARREWKRH